MTRLVRPVFPCTLDSSTAVWNQVRKQPRKKVRSLVQYWIEGTLLARYQLEEAIRKIK